MTGSIHFVVLWIGKIDNAPPNFRARRLEPIRAADQEQTVAESEIQLAFRLVLKRLDASLAGDVAPARGAAADLHLAGHDDVEPAAGFAFGENGAATGEVSSLGPPGQRPGRRCVRRLERSPPKMSRLSKPIRSPSTWRRRG